MENSIGQMNGKHRCVVQDADRAAYVGCVYVNITGCECHQ